MRHETPWVVTSPERDQNAFDVMSADGHKLHHGHWGYRETATLIAAAPDMLEALGQLIECYGADTIGAMWDTARAAIEKAEGR